MTFKGGIEALILASLREQPGHGYAISKRIKSGSQESLKFSEGQLYPALHRLEEAGLITAEWELQEGKPARKTYSITESGLAELQKQLNQWQNFAENVSRVLNGTKEVARA